MIDPHVHLRDWRQQNKETVHHGLVVAHKAGLNAVFEMPNTDPPLVTAQLAEKRIALADAAGVPVFHGLYGGLTADADQVRAIVKAYNRLFPGMVGLKLFAGRSTGSLSVIKEEEQQLVFRILAAAGFRGVVAVHCEKEALFLPRLWNAQKPHTHCLVRPPLSEVESVRDMIRFALRADFRGTLHICHISTPHAVLELEHMRSQADFQLTCGITPHHALLNSRHMQTFPLLKMNPPLRSPALQREMLQLLLAGRITWIESDHAPHTLAGKPLASGIPGLPFLPRFIRHLRALGIEPALLKNLSHHNVCRVFQIDIADEQKIADYELAGEYEFDPFGEIFQT